MRSDIPSIRSVDPGEGRQVVVTWKGGAESVIDVADQIAKFAVFRPLRSSEQLFREVRVGEWGWCAHWSDEMEISSETLWGLALEQGAAWLRDWRVAHRVTQAQAAKALGVSPRMWRYYEAGSHLLPKTVMLAAMGFDARLNALPETPNLAAAHQWLHADIIFAQSPNLARRMPAGGNIARSLSLTVDTALVLQPTLYRPLLPNPIPAATDAALVAAMSATQAEFTTAPHMSGLEALGITQMMVN